MLTLLLLAAAVWSVGLLLACGLALAAARGDRALEAPPTDAHRSPACPGGARVRGGAARAPARRASAWR
jgi:hypothetical protein